MIFEYKGNWTLFFHEVRTRQIWRLIIFEGKRAWFVL